MLLGPVAAALVALIGLTHSLPIVAVMLLTAAIGIGIVHPEGSLIAHSLSSTHKTVGMTFFLSGGYFGFSFGSVVSGLWVEHFGQSLPYFWLLAAPAVVVGTLVLLSGLHRLKVHAEQDEQASIEVLPFQLVLALAVCVASNMCILIRLIPILLVRSFPNQAAQGWAGAAVSVMGISGVLCAFVWAYLSERFGCGKLIFALQLLSVPFLYLILHIESPSMASVWAIGIGATLGSVFPLCVALARQARGLGQRLRMGLAIGGSWAVGEMSFILAGKYITLSDPDSPKPVITALKMCWFILTATAILSAIAARMEKRNIKITEVGAEIVP